MEFEDPLITSLVQYIADEKFQTEFESFFLKNALSFSDDEEHKLEYMDIYKDFQSMFDNHMEGITRDTKKMKQRINFFAKGQKL